MAAPLRECDTPEQAARQAFPRGLMQPEGGFRFGADALLLAAFAATMAGNRVLDLGTGCGAAGLGLLLARQDTDSRVLGLDRDPAMVDAAGQNARRLGLADRFTAQLLDVRDIRSRPEVTPESVGLALANPPYRHPGSGRPCQDASRQSARFETQGELADFAAAAAYALANGGHLACVYLAERLTYAIATLSARRLEIKTILPVHPRQGAPATHVLLLARKNGRPGLFLQSPLFLYEGTGPTTRLTEAALRFCPFLACNAGLATPSPQ